MDKVLQSLQGHSFDSSFFMPDLRASKDFAFFIWKGTSFQILGPRKPNDSLH